MWLPLGCTNLYPKLHRMQIIKEIMRQIRLPYLLLIYTYA